MIGGLIFLVAFAASAVNAYPIFRLLIALKSRQDVSKFAPEGHQAKQGTPTMGGLIVAVGFITAALAYVLVYCPGRSAAIIGLFIGFALIGFVDDYVVPRLMVGKRGLGWKQKIVMQLAVASICSWILCGDFSGVMLATVFLILFFSNAYNFSDGLDGLAALLLIGLGSGLLGIAYLRHVDHLAPILAALLGAILPFLYLNKPKAKLFMGDVGSLPIGAVLGFAVAAIAFPNDFDFLYPTIPFAVSAVSSLPEYMRPDPGWMVYLALFVISGIMIVELVPVPLQILSVKIRKKRLFSFTPVHHAFERKGWPELQVVIAFVGCQLVMSMIAIGLTVEAPLQDAVFRDMHELAKPGAKWHSVDRAYSMRSRSTRIIGEVMSDRIGIGEHPSFLARTYRWPKDPDGRETSGIYYAGLN